MDTTPRGRTTRPSPTPGAWSAHRHAYDLAEAEQREQRKKEHAQNLEAARVLEARRQARRAHPIAPPAAVAQLGTAGSPTARPEWPQDLETTTPQELATLIRVWQEASLAARQAFRWWVNAPPLADVAPRRTSAQTQRYAAEIARLCGAAAPVG